MNGVPENQRLEFVQNAKVLIGIEKRKCFTCQTIKSLEEFCRNKWEKSGRSRRCKECVNRIERQARIDNPNKLKEYKKQWRMANNEKTKGYTKKWRMANPDKVRIRRQRHDRKIYYTPRGKLTKHISHYIRHSLKNGSKTGRHWETLVDFTIDQLKTHLKKQFKEGMTWDNYGKWHVDHIIPISAFNFEKPEDIDFKRCWSLKNLQPMWRKENIRKSNKLEKPFQPSLII